MIIKTKNILSLVTLLFFSVNTIAAIDCSAQPWLVGDEADLSDAIMCYNGKTISDNYTISVTQNINLTVSSTEINNVNTGVTLLLHGNDFTIDGQDITLLRPFELDANTTATFQNITIIRGNAASIGAGILNSGTLIVNNSTIRNNSVGEDGGGIYNRNNATLTLNNSTIRNNTAGEDGGGIGSLGTIIINNCVIHNNTAGEDGGGGILNRGTLTVNNSTISDNEAVIGDGGGILNRNTLTINNSTIAGNSSDSAATGVFNNGTLIISNTIVDNAITGNNCLAGSNYNLISNGGNTCGLVDGADGNIIGQSPLLGTLQDNGGVTFTQALLSNSPAINAGDPTHPTTGYDQRGVGFDRVTNGRLDIGAYETAGLYTIGGTVTGLAIGNTLTLQNNASDDLTVNSDGSFTFATVLVDGSTYAVTVLSQPNARNQICTVNNGNGQLNGADVVDISINCSVVLPINIPLLNNWNLLLLILLMLSVVTLKRRFLN